MDSGIAGEPKLLAQAHLVTTPVARHTSRCGQPEVHDTSL
ncbi:hypothetical protein ECDEC6E_1878 [Escherichia coli DEC6E]|nr:hypothetical protein ECDEC6E_1878 [Escherichia coli DEC6E]